MKEGRFQNKVVIVTGGGSGLGQTYCYAFAKEGALVVCPDINFDAAKETISEIRKKGGEGLPIKTDVTKPEEVRNMVAETIKNYNEINILINNAGIVLRNELLDTAEEDWDKVINTNLKGVFLVTKAVVPHLIKRKNGKIVNIASIMALRGVGETAYAAAKAGIIAMARVWAFEFAQYHLCVNSVAPGFIATPMNEEVRKTPVGKAMDRRIPYGYGTIGCIVPVVLFLSSSESDYITGQCIVVDGGLTACLDMGPEFREFVKGLARVN